MLINSCVGRVAREFGDPLALLLNIEFRGGLGEGMHESDGWGVPVSGAEPQRGAGRSPAKKIFAISSTFEHKNGVKVDLAACNSARERASSATAPLQICCCSAATAAVSAAPCSCQQPCWHSL